MATTLIDAHAEMVKAKSPYHNKFMKAYKHFGYKDDDLFSKYIQFVLQYTKKWFEETVPAWVDQSNANQQFNGIKHIWEHPESYPTLAPLVSDEAKTYLLNNVPLLLNELTGEGKRFTPKKRKGKQPEHVDRMEHDSDSVSEEPPTDNDSVYGHGQEPDRSSMDVDVLYRKLNEVEAENRVLVADNNRFSDLVKKQKRMLELLLAVSDPLKDNHMFGPIKDFIMENF